MEFLDRFSLEDVVIVFIGLLIVSIFRIYYDSYVSRKKATRFGSSLGIYNNLLSNTKEGLLIIAANDQVIYINTEAQDILNTKTYAVDVDYLNTVTIENTDTHTKENLLDIIHTQSHMPNASIMHNLDPMAISISINTINIPNSHTEDIWYVVILQDMTSILELREGVTSLLDA